MGTRIEGFVKKIFEKSGRSARGAWTAHSFKIESAQGEEDKYFYQLGFNNPPKFDEGDFISFEYEDKDDTARTFIKGTGNKPAPPEKEAPPAKNYKGAATVKSSELFGDIGGYNTEDDIRRMSYSSCRGDAISVVGLLLANDALPMSGAKAKAGQAKRFAEINAMVDKLTVEYFFDAASGRKIDIIQDGGTVDVKADIDLPDSDESAPPAPTPADNDPDAIPPEEEDGSF